MSRHNFRREHRRGPDMPPVISEEAWIGRRRLLEAFGFGGVSALLASCGGSVTAFQGETEPLGESGWAPGWEPAGGGSLYPAARNQDYRVARATTPQDVAARHNNIYEFHPGRAGPVYKHVGDFSARPWQVEIRGEVEEERTVDIDDIARVAPLEERIYRFRCVEAWSMVVPWTGLPMADFVRWCKPKESARFVRFVSFLDPARAEGQRKAKHYPWPYYEGLRMDEAMHPLAMLATGIFGHGLPMQHGAPLRVIVPWKYGFKSLKSFVRVEFTRKQPGTFWNDLQSKEYSFLSNVEPDVPHPRWSQSTERDIATGDRIPTLPFNGYGDQVAKLY